MTTLSLHDEQSLKQSSAEPPCPYRGLDPFTESQEKYFFGRDEESHTLAANALTAPITILYGPSGVGKSSLVMAGLVPELRKYSETIVVLFRTWREPDIIGALNKRLAEAVRGSIGVELDTSRGFDECAKKVATLTRATIIVIFDQFEELFLYHPAGSPTGDAFDVQFARVVNRRESGFNFLLSLREDWMAKLDRFQRNIPNLLSNYIRLDHLDEKGARMAIEEPLTAWNKEARAAGQPVMSLDTALVPVLIDQVKTGNVDIAGEGHGAHAGAVTHDGRLRVETPFLQMILQRLWETECAETSNVMRLETFERLGGAKRIVHAYVDDTMRRLGAVQQETAASLFDRLVTPSACKIALRVRDLQDFAGERSPEVPELLQALAEKRILRAIGTHSEPQYEIFHDVLAQPILAWRTTYLTKMNERKKIRRAMRTRMAAAAVILITVLAVGGWHVLRDRASESHNRAHDMADGLLSEARVEMKNRPASAAMKSLRAVATSGDKHHEADVAAIATSMLESGRALARQQKVKEAAPFFLAAHKVFASLQLGYQTRHASRGIAYCASKAEQSVAFAAAIAQLNREVAAVKSRSEKAEAFMLVGTLYTALQKPDDALQQFTNALTVCEPGDGVRRAQILYNQAAAEHARYGVGSAIATLLRALNDAGSHVDLKLPILQSLASYSYEAHEEKGAGEYQRQIAELPRQALTD